MPEELFSELPDTVFVKNDINYGFAKANNRLLKLAEGFEWVLLLNPDAFLSSDCLKNLIQTTQQYPEYSVFGCRLLKGDNPVLLDGDGDCYHVSGLAWRKMHGRPAIGRQHGPQEVFSVCAAAAMYRLDAIREVGGFDEDFFCYFEDVDLGFRLRLYGYRSLLVPSAIAMHVGSASTGGPHSDFALYYGHRNLVWTFIKNMPTLFFVLFICAHLALNVISFAWFAHMGKGRVIAAAKIDALINIKKMWVKRRKIQRDKSVDIVGLLRLMDKSLIPRMDRLL